MYYVYILKDSNGKLYIGYSNDLRRRIKEHLQQKVNTTKRMIDPKLVYYEAYEQEIAARERERKLKKFGSSYTGLIKRLKIR